MDAFCFALQDRLGMFDNPLVAMWRQDEVSRRIMQLPVVGPVVATALVSNIGDAAQFRSGREMVAWIGLVPRQCMTGGKPRLGGIGRRANHYLRRLLIRGARAVALRLRAKADRASGQAEAG